MLPATPLQHLLLAPLDTAVVATSANRRGEALIYQDTDAVELLAAVADAILMYDREILHPLDDSIVQVVLERTMVLRRARGFDLYCGDLPQSSNTALAYGADLKNCIAVNRGTEILSAPHVGNLDSVSAEKLLASRAEALCEIYQLTPAQALCDRHPDYVSHRLAHDSGLPVHEIQHHRAHAWATLLENPAAGRPLLAAVWDGTGYGEDGTVWGGEFFLLAQRGETRIASLYPLRLPGAEQAIREPARVAFSLLYTLFGAGALDHPALPASSTLDYALLARLLEQGVNTPQCSSVGRLFDGVAALLGLSPAVDYEAEAAIGLEQLASRYRNRQDLVPYPTALLDQETPWRLDWRPMLLELLADWHDPASTADYIAARFHLSMAHAILHVVKATGCEEVLVGGGCFQNRVLMDMLYRLARQQQVTLHWPRTLPPGDGAIAAGQLTAQLMRQGDD
jgi:hydrogenase maturation protein HypF